MNETACVVGIDVAKRKFDIALLINNKIKSKVFDNTPSGHKAFAEWLSERGAKPAQAHLCMEATGPYSETLATNLVAEGWRVSVTKYESEYASPCCTVPCDTIIWPLAGVTTTPAASLS